MTINEVKARHLSLCPDSHFFDRDAMRFFGQTLRSFRVTYIGHDKYEITAPMYDKSREPRVYMGTTKRIFDYVSGTLTLN